MTKKTQILFMLFVVNVLWELYWKLYSAAELDSARGKLTRRIHSELCEILDKEADDV